MSYITSESPFLLLVLVVLVATTQLYTTELFPSATFIHWCQNLAFTVCPCGRCVGSLVPAPSQNKLGCRLIGNEFLICKCRSKAVALFHTSRPIGVSRTTQDDKGEHCACHCNYGVEASCLDCFGARGVFGSLGSFWEKHSFVKATVCCFLSHIIITVCASSVSFLSRSQFVALVSKPCPRSHQ